MENETTTIPGDAVVTTEKKSKKKEAAPKATKAPKEAKAPKAAKAPKEEAPKEEVAPKKEPAGDVVLDMAAYRTAAEVIKCASDGTRLAILDLLKEVGSANVTEIAQYIGNCTQPGISHHLALLRHSSLVEPNRDGKTNIYSLTEAGRSLVDVLTPMMPAD